MLWDFRSRRVGRFAAVEPTGLLRSSVDESEASDLRDAMASVGSLGALDYIARGVAELPGRKCVVFLSEGFPAMFKDRGESGRIWRSMARMLGRANAAGVVVCTIYARGLVAGGGGLTAEDNPQESRPYVSSRQTGVDETYAPRRSSANRPRGGAASCSIRRSHCSSSRSRPADSRSRTPMT